MIHTLAAVTMTFLGCGDALQDCQFISQSKTVYENHAKCEEAIPPLLMKMDDTDYPVVTGHCNPDAEQSVAAAEPLDQTKPLPLAPVDLGQQPSNTENPKPTKRVVTRIENGFAYVRTGTTNLLTNIGERTRNGLNKLAVSLKLRKEQPVQ